MSKKIVALCALLSINLVFAANGYPASGGYQADQGYQANGHHHDKHHHHRDKITDAADERTLAALDKADEEASFYLNLSRVGLATGAITASVGFLALKDSRPIIGGIGILAVSYAANTIVANRTNERAQQREEILVRRKNNNSN